MPSEIPSVRAYDSRYDMYELQKDIPGADKGAIFFLDPGASVFGEPHVPGALILCWTPEGNCFYANNGTREVGLCGGGIIFNGILKSDPAWFKKVSKVDKNVESAQSILRDLVQHTESALAQMKKLLK